MGNLTELLSKIGPAVYQESSVVDPSLRNSKNPTFVESVARINVQRSVKAVVERSFILEQLIEKGQIGVIGAMYDIETGVVHFYEDERVFTADEVRRLRSL